MASGETCTEDEGKRGGQKYEDDTPWRAEVDVASGHTYFIHVETHDTQWEVPSEGYKMDDSSEIQYEVRRAVTPAREKTEIASLHIGHETAVIDGDNDATLDEQQEENGKDRQQLMTEADQNLFKFTDPSQQFVTDDFCAQILTGDMDPKQGRQLIEDLRQAVARKREKELEEQRSGKGAAGKRVLQDLGHLRRCLHSHFPEIDPSAIVTVSALRKACLRLFEQKGFTRTNTVFATSTCTEDQVKVFRNSDWLPFGGPGGFKMGGLSGLPACGQMGMFILSGLVPEDNGTLLIQYGPTLGIDKYGDLGHTERKDGRCAILHKAICGTFPPLARESLESDLERVRREHIAESSRRRRERHRQEPTTAKKEEEDSVFRDEFSQQFDDLKSALNGHMRGIRGSPDIEKRTMYGVYDEIRNGVEALVKWLFDNKRLEAREYYQTHRIRFEREERYLEEEMRKHPRNQLETRETIQSAGSSRAGSRGRRRYPTSAKPLTRLQELEIEFAISTALLGVITLETPPQYPNFAIVQNLELFMDDGDRRNFTGTLLQVLDEIQNTGSDDETDEESGGDG